MENDFSSHFQPFELFLSLHIHKKPKLGRKKYMDIHMESYKSNIEMQILLH